MALLLTFGLTLMAAVLISERAERTVLSTAVLFLVTGLAYGSLAARPSEQIVSGIAELALVVVLLGDASKVSLRHLRRAWQLPGRALLLGMPLTMAFTALLAVAIVGLSWTNGLLVGAVLAPTDPVFASAIVGADAIPRPVRHLLNVESGVNDGLALPFVVALLAIAAPAGSESFHALALGGELAGGILIGVVVPAVAVGLARTRAFGATERYLRLGALASGVVVYALCSVVGANPFLGSFAAGVTIGTLSHRARVAYEPLGESLGELLKLGALLLLGALLSAGFIVEAGVSAWLFAAAALVLARPVAIFIALLGSPLSWRERAVAGWFGPKGFASVVYGLLVAHSGIEQGRVVMHAIGAAVVLSIVAHSSTDVPVTSWFRRRAEATRSFA